ncbi:hypothetical protein [Bdellovibrio sp. HCB337]|uniref:hypothetical protein n=1 Tax=Bdellovibrio sp. HCB337 TaxID=3394358 RepID=UPI0039A77300
MKMNSTKMYLGFALLTLVLAFQNCSNAKFTSQVDSEAILNGTTGGDDPNACRPTMVDSNKIIKVLFVVDTSGSNEGEGGSVASDPNKAWRSASISAFLNRYSGKSNFYYGLTTFQGSSSKAHIKIGGSAGFSNDAATVQSGYNSFMATSDTGSTPYKAALNLAKSMISADLSANAAQKASYVMIMISDGQATDYRSPNDVIPDASSIKNLAPSQISLNSVYYYSKNLDVSQTQYLKNISSIGEGSFITANSNQVLSIDDVVKVPSSNCQ